MNLFYLEFHFTFLLTSVSFLQDQTLSNIESSNPLAINRNLSLINNYYVAHVDFFYTHVRTLKLIICQNYF